MHKNYLLSKADSFWKCIFDAMASPCEILFHADFDIDAQKFAEFAYTETKRIESKFSRYLSGNIIDKINSSNGSRIEVDHETARMFDFAQQCYKLSDGLFDITSGVLRKCWTFDGTDQTPQRDKLESLLSLVGFEKIIWDKPFIQLQPEMQIDFGGIGKEYAVDRVAEFAKSYNISKVMVNFGGDIRAINADLDSSPWVIGIENPEQQSNAIGKVELLNGGIATSGDANRFCFYNGKRLGHILNPKTGFPIEDAPRSVTVISTNCTEAGIIATMAMLQGNDAEEFLELQDVKFNCVRV